MSAVIAIITRLALPLIAFLFIGVPLESYVRGLSGFLSIDKNAVQLMANHMFIEAAACFYCITVLLECVLIMTRPHVRSNPRINTGIFNWACSIICMISVVSYTSIRYQITEKSLNSVHAEILLSILLILTIFITTIIHIIDYMCSEGISSTPSTTDRASG